MEQIIATNAGSELKSNAETIFDLINRSFQYGSKSFRSVVIKEDIWFCGKDIASILGYANLNQALLKNVDNEDTRTLQEILRGSTGDTPVNYTSNELNANFINESGLYSLILKSRLEAAKKFKKYVTSEVLPSIRKLGQEQYIRSLEEAKQKEQHLLEKMKERDETEQLLLQETKQKEEEIATLKRQQLMLSSYVKNMVSLEKNQILYLATTVAYAAQCRFEFGGVKEPKELRGRLAGYNTGRAEGDLLYFCKVIKCNNYKLVEDRLHVVLKQFKDKPDAKKEMVRLRYDLLEEVVELVCDNFDKEIDFINEKCQEYLRKTVYTEPVIPEPISLNDHIEISHHRNGERQRTEVIDVSAWSDIQINSKIEELIELCALEKKQVAYNFQAQKDTVPLELSWSILSPYMKQFRGLTMTEWRQVFKNWHKQAQPRKLIVRGIKV